MAVCKRHGRFRPGVQIKKKRLEVEKLKGRDYRGKGTHGEGEDPPTSLGEDWGGLGGFTL